MAASTVFPQALRDLIGHFKRLPGIGQRTAERLALALLDWSERDLQQLGDELAKLHERVMPCTICGNFADGDRCVICRAANREPSQICVVEHPGQVAVIETSGCYRGHYHVLGGRLQPLEGKGPEDLRVAALWERIRAGSVQELILALSSDVEGEATASYLAAEFGTAVQRISRIAAGVPVGADLSYADAMTVAVAMAERRPLPGDNNR